MEPDLSAARILVVDDEEGVCRSLVRVLERGGFTADSAHSGEEARAILEGQDYELLLSDVDMPGMSGLDLILEVGETHPETAAVMVTALDDAKFAQTALELGAYGYIIKPFEPNEIIINVTNALRRRHLEIENRAHRDRLEQMVRDRTTELWSAVADLEKAQEGLKRSREETIHRLSIAAEFRDDETGRHIQRMSRYCHILALAIGMSEERAELVRVASQMHDVGKIGTPDNILLKPGPLTPEERSIMERHAEIGYNILSGSDSELLDLAATIAFTHHERLDGTGYPRGLAGDEIPLEGRMAAIADVFDALTSDRVYKQAFPLDRSIEIMRSSAGTHLDPDLLELFLQRMDLVLEVKARYADPMVKLGSL